MAVDKVAQLAPVIDMAERAEREAVKKLGQGQVQLAQAASKLTELEQYRDDYAQRWQLESSQGVTAQWLINYQRFMSQLDTAITQQQRSVSWHQGNLEKLRQQWQQRHARLGGLRKLVERHLQEARKVADKREQKQLDEFCQRRPSAAEF